ncbi:MAG: PIN domain-containing protein [Actinomycetota bacterium]|nr:PIN domain-containing protein [Actinomycetota bacterium]
MALLIDTDVLIDVERGAGTPEVERVLGDEERAISVITVSELLHGALRASGGRGTRRRAFVEHLLSGMQAVPITERVARAHADLWVSLAEGGQVIGAHDLWIAATAIAHGFGVATRNVADFARVPGLRVVVPA